MKSQSTNKEKIQFVKTIIWSNLFIGIYNLYLFDELNSMFHLILGALNIGVWVFFRNSVTKIASQVKNNR